MRRRGHTLVETLIASSLFLLALVLCGELSVLGARSSSSTTDKNQYFRQASVGLEQLDRDLQHTTAIYSPGDFSSSNLLGSAQSGLVLHPGASAAALVLQSSSVTGAAVVGYRFDSPSASLMRVLYDPGYDPADPATQKVLSGTRSTALSGWLSDFSVLVQDPKYQYGCYLVNSTLVVLTTSPTTLPAGPTLPLTTSSKLRVLF